MYIFIFAFAFIGFASAQTDVPRATANMSSNAQQVSSGQTYQLNCDYTIHKPSDHSSDTDWELTVAFHKVVMADKTILGEFRQNGNNMTFHTVKILEGLNVWPVDGATTTGLESPKRVYAMTGPDSMHTGGTWMCSVTMKLKGTDVKVRFDSKAYTPSFKPSQ